MNINDLNVVLRFHPWERVFPIGTETYVPCSVHKGFITVKGKMHDLYEYRFEYEENDAIGCCWCFCPESSCLGYHKKDVESLIFLVDRLTEEIQSVYFKAHGRGQGVWRTWEDCEKTQAGALIAYVARGSHAFYPKKGIYLRGFGFANDLCSDGGEKYYIQVNNVYYDDHHTPVLDSIKSWERLILPISKQWVRRGS